MPRSWRPCITSRIWVRNQTAKNRNGIRSPACSPSSSRVSSKLLQSSLLPEFADFAFASDIKVLHLSYVVFPDGVPFSFPSLQELSLHQVSLCLHRISYSLPSLLHLSYSSFERTPQLDEIGFMATSAPHLASISFSFGRSAHFNFSKYSRADKGAHPEILFAFNVMTLPYTFGSVFPRGTGIKNLRLSVEPNFARFIPAAPDRNVDTLKVWVDELQDMENIQSLETLYLPKDLDPQRSGLSWGMREQTNRLVRCCAEKAVEIVWEGLTTDYNAERLCSREFTKRAERIKRAREA